jgi:hypothetical protein
MQPPQPKEKVEEISVLVSVGVHSEGEEIALVKAYSLDKQPTNQPTKKGVATITEAAFHPLLYNIRDITVTGPIQRTTRMSTVMLLVSNASSERKGSS